MKIKDDFFYPEIEDLASIELADVTKILPKPMSTATTKRSAVVITGTCDVEVKASGMYTYEAHQSIMCDFNCIKNVETPILL